MEKDVSPGGYDEEVAPCRRCTRSIAPCPTRPWPVPGPPRPRARRASPRPWTPNRARIDSLDGSLQGVLERQRRVGGRTAVAWSSSATTSWSPIKPLATKLTISAKAESIGKITGIASGMGLFVGRLVSFYSPGLAIPFMVADLAVLAASFASVHWARQAWDRDYPRPRGTDRPVERPQGRPRSRAGWPTGSTRARVARLEGAPGARARARARSCKWRPP